MKKRKINKRVLLAALAFAVLASLFAVSASAYVTGDEFSVCDCIKSADFVVGAPVVADGTHYATFEVECPTCKTVYVVCVDEFYDIHPFYSCYFFNTDENNNYAIGLNFLAEDKSPVGDGNDYYIDTISIKTDVADSSSMVGSMVGTMTQGVGGILVGVGNSIVGFFDNTVLDDNGNLTTFATWALAFLGLAFGLGVVKFITHLVKK